MMPEWIAKVRVTEVREVVIHAGTKEGAAAIAESGDWPMQFNSALVSLEREVEDVRPNE